MGGGGPAKGAGKGGPARPFTADTPRTSFHSAPVDPAKTAARKEREAAKAARNAQMLELIGDIALNADRQEAQLSAAIAYLNREEGMPIARNQNENRDMTLEEMVRESLAPKPTST